MSQSFTREAARRLLHVSEKQLKSCEQQKLVQPAVRYGFRELLALRTLIKLRSSRVPPQQIRRAIQALIEKLRDVKDPLTELKLYVDGKRIRVELEGRAMNLRTPGDLAGNYIAVSAGGALVGGVGVARLRNANGVVLVVRGPRLGAGISINLARVTITMM